MGWEGDIHLEVEFDLKEDRWVVFDTVTEPAQMILARPFDGMGVLEVIPALCTQLKQAQVQRGEGFITVADRMNKWNLALEEQRARQHNEERTEILREFARHVRHRL